MKRAAGSKLKNIGQDTTGAAGTQLQDDSAASEHPDHFDRIDNINNRITQLHSLFGVVRSMGGNAGLQEVGIAPEDLAGVAWLVDDLLEEVEEHADQLHKDLCRARASRPAGKGRTQPSADAA